MYLGVWVCLKLLLLNPFTALIISSEVKLKTAGLTHDLTHAYARNLVNTGHEGEWRSVEGWKEVDITEIFESQNQTDKKSAEVKNACNWTAISHMISGRWASFSTAATSRVHAHTHTTHTHTHTTHHTHKPHTLTPHTHTTHTQTTHTHTHTPHTQTTHPHTRHTTHTPHTHTHTHAHTPFGTHIHFLRKQPNLLLVWTKLSVSPQTIATCHSPF